MASLWSRPNISKFWFKVLDDVWWKTGQVVRFGNLVGFGIIDAVARVAVAVVVVVVVVMVVEVVVMVMVVLPWKFQGGEEHREKKVAWRGHIPGTSLAAHVYDRPENVSLAHAKSRKAKDVAIKTARLKMKPHCDFACVNACISQLKRIHVWLAEQFVYVCMRVDKECF